MTLLIVWGSTNILQHNVSQYRSGQEKAPSGAGLRALILRQIIEQLSIITVLEQTDILCRALAQARSRWCHFLLMTNINIMLCTHQKKDANATYHTSGWTRAMQPPSINYTYITLCVHYIESEIRAGRPSVPMFAISSIKQ